MGLQDPGMGISTVAHASITSTFAPAAAKATRTAKAETSNKNSTDTSIILLGELQQSLPSAEPPHPKVVEGSA